MTVPPHLLPYGLGVSLKEVLFIKHKNRQVNNSGLMLKTCFSVYRCISYAQHADYTAIWELRENCSSRQPDAIKYTWNLRGPRNGCWEHSPNVSGMGNNAQVKQEKREGKETQLENLP